jgi:hypothetical protein
MSKRYRSVLYAYLSCCFCKKDQRMFINQKNQQTRRLIKQNSNDEKQKESMKIKN